VTRLASRRCGFAPGGQRFFCRDHAGFCTNAWRQSPRRGPIRTGRIDARQSRNPLICYSRTWVSLSPGEFGSWAECRQLQRRPDGDAASPRVGLAYGHMRASRGMWWMRLNRTVAECGLVDDGESMIWLRPSVTPQSTAKSLPWTLSGARLQPRWAKSCRRNRGIDRGLWAALRRRSPESAARDIVFPGCKALRGFLAIRLYRNHNTGQIRDLPHSFSRP